MNFFYILLGNLLPMGRVLGTSLKKEENVLLIDPLFDLLKRAPRQFRSPATSKNEDVFAVIFSRFCGKVTHPVSTCRYIENKSNSVC